MLAQLSPPLRPSSDRLARRLRLILGDQLNAAHPWFREQDPHTVYVMMELRCESEYLTHHIQKIAGIFAGMRAFANALTARGHALHYINITDPENNHTFVDNLKALARRYGASSLEYQEPDEYRLDHVLAKLSDQLGGPCRSVDTHHFMTTRSCVGQFFEGKKVWRMENFCRAMRKRHKILLGPQGGPLGERWNFDAENRNKLPKDAKVPPPFEFRNDLTSIVQEIHAAKLPHIGRICAQQIGWPITRAQARTLLSDFLVQRLAQFGRYQDALARSTLGPRPGLP